MSNYDNRYGDKKKDVPQSQEAEAALLGCLLSCQPNQGEDSLSSLYDEVSQIAAPKHFFNPVHVRIAETVWKRCRRRQHVDPIILKNKFSQDETLQHIGGVEYLALLVENAPPYSTAIEYAKLVADYSCRRELIAFGKTVEEMAVDPDTDLDASEMFESLKHDLDGMRAIFPATAEFIVMADAALEGVEEVGNFSSQGMSTGIIELDECIGGIHRDDFIVIGGRPRHGKTSLVSNIMRHRSESGILGEDGNIERPCNVLFFSLEMSPQQIGVRALSHWVYEREGIEIQYRDIMNHNISHDEKQLLLKHLPAMKKTWKIHIDATKNLTGSEIVARSRAFTKKYGPLDIVGVDYSQRLSYADTEARNEHQGMNDTLARFADFAGEDHLGFILLSQLTREVDRRDGHRPVISDLRGSGGYEEHATIIAFLKREIVYLTEKGPPKKASIDDRADYEADVDEWSNKAEIIIAKNKRGPERTLVIGAEVAYDQFSSLQSPGHEANF